MQLETKLLIIALVLVDPMIYIIATTVLLLNQTQFLITCKNHDRSILFNLRQRGSSTS